LSHHWPLVGDVRDYPIHVIEALKDAQIERVNASWAAQCSDVRLAEWGAKVVRAFVDEWWRIGRVPAEIERLHWEYRIACCTAPLTVFGAGGDVTEVSLALRMRVRRFPPPWTAEETDACFIVR
jgi:hypothetical protein